MLDVGGAGYHSLPTKCCSSMATLQRREVSGCQQIQQRISDAFTELASKAVTSLRNIPDQLASCRGLAVHHSVSIADRNIPQQKGYRVQPCAYLWLQSAGRTGRKSLAAHSDRVVPQRPSCRTTATPVTVVWFTAEMSRD